MTRITVRVTTHSKMNEVIGCEHGVWKIRLCAPPIDGKANAELIKLLAKKFDRAPSDIRIVKGHGSKIKLVEMGSR